MASQYSHIMRRACGSLQAIRVSVRREAIGREAPHAAPSAPEGADGAVDEAAPRLLVQQDEGALEELAEHAGLQRLPGAEAAQAEQRPDHGGVREVHAPHLGDSTPRADTHTTAGELAELELRKEGVDQRHASW